MKFNFALSLPGDQYEVLGDDPHSGNIRKLEMVL